MSMLTQLLPLSLDSIRLYTSDGRNDQLHILNCIMILLAMKPAIHSQKCFLSVHIL